MAAAQQSKPRFVRKGGKVVPIRSGGGAQPKRQAAPAKKPAKKAKPKTAKFSSAMCGIAGWVLAGLTTGLVSRSHRQRNAKSEPNRSSV